MTAAMPETLDDLSDWLAERLDDGHRPIVSRLVSLAKDLRARLTGHIAVWPSEFDTVLSLAFAWCLEKADDDALQAGRCRVARGYDADAFGRLR